MTAEEREEFFIDPRIIDWDFYVRAYIHGMQTYILKEDVISPIEQK